MNASLNIPSIPNDQIWFASRNAWIAYWAQAYVTIDDLDPATATTYGAVKQAATVSFSNTTIVPTYVSFIDMMGTTVYIVDQSTVTNILTKLNATAAALDSLITNLKASGAVA